MSDGEAVPAPSGRVVGDMPSGAANPSDPGIASSNRLHTLHGLRGLAALMVLVYHVLPYATRLKVGSGFLAVDLFFLLSGVVIARAYDGRLSAGMSAATFLKLRLLRLYPLYVAGLAVSIVGLAVAHLVGFMPPSIRRSSAALAFGLLYLPTPPALSPIPGMLFPLDGVAWSLF